MRVKAARRPRCVRVRTVDWRKVCVKGTKLMRCVVKAVDRQKVHSKEDKPAEMCAKGSVCGEKINQFCEFAADTLNF